MSEITQRRLTVVCSHPIRAFTGSGNLSEIACVQLVLPGEDLPAMEHPLVYELDDGARIAQVWGPRPQEIVQGPDDGRLPLQDRVLRGHRIYVPRATGDGSASPFGMRDDATREPRIQYRCERCGERSGPMVFGRWGDGFAKLLRESDTMTIEVRLLRT